MRYRLKSDPSVECEVKRKICSGELVEYYVYKGDGYVSAWFYLGPDVFCKIWEPAPEPPAVKPMSIEDRCQHYAKSLMEGSSPCNSARSAILASNLDEAAAEILRLRGEVLSLTADRDERAKQKGELLAEIERLRKDYDGMVAVASSWMARYEYTDRMLKDTRALCPKVHT